MATIYEVLDYGAIVAKDDEHGLLVTVNGSYFNLWVQQAVGGSFTGNMPDQWENTDVRPLSNLDSTPTVTERERVDARMAVKEAVQELERVGGRVAIVAKLEVCTKAVFADSPKPHGLYGRDYTKITEYAEEWLKSLTRVCDCCDTRLEYREQVSIQDLVDNDTPGNYYAGFTINWAERYFCDEVSCVNEMLTTYDGDTVRDLELDQEVTMPDAMLCYECDKIVPHEDYSHDQECCSECREITLKDLRDEYEAEKAGV